MAASPNRPRLRRSRTERVLFGVCGGLAEYANVDPTLVRIGTVLLTLFPPTSAVGLLGYVALAVLLPEEGTEHLPGRERLQRSLTGLRTDVRSLSETVRAGLRGRRVPPVPGDETATALPEDEAVDRATHSAGRDAA